MFSDDKEMEAQGYIVGARILPKALTKKILDTYKPLRSFPREHRGRRLVVSWSLVRARKDAHDRQKAIAKLVKKLERSDRELLSSHGNKRAVEGAARLTRRQNPRGRTVGRGHQHS